MFPILFESSMFIVYSLWFFVTLAFAAGSFVFYQLMQQSRLSISFITNNSFKFLIYSLVISRALAIISNPTYFFRTDPETGFSLFGSLINFITFWDKELSFWGGLIGFFFVFVREAMNEKQPFAKWADILTISVITAISIGNIGAYLDGINYGRPTILPWGVTFQSSFVKYAIDIHPTQIYAFLYSSLIALFLYFLYNKYRAQYDGLITYVGFFLFSSFRFCEGFFRGDDTITLAFNNPDSFLRLIRIPELIFLTVAILSFRLMRKYQEKYHIPVFSLISNKIKLWQQFSQKVWQHKIKPFLNNKLNKNKSS